VANTPHRGNTQCFRDWHEQLPDFIKREEVILKKKRANKRKVIEILLFIIYLVGLVYFLFFAESMGRKISNREYSYNLVLFKEITRFIKYHNELGMTAVLTNILGNIVCFIPFGFMLPILSTKARKFILVCLISFELSIVIEITQLIFKVGSFDVDDIVLNTLGGLVGFILYYTVNKLVGKWYKK
jgi:glycopeptide antibiotics resistance protein